MPAEIKTIDPIRVVGVEHRGPYQEIGKAFGHVFQMAGQGAWPIRGALGIFYDDPTKTPAAELRSKACIIVPDGFSAAGADTFEIPGGEHVVYRHVGSYATLGDAWMMLYSKELPRLGRDDAGPSFEIYVSDMATTPENELITDLYIPVRPR